MKINKGKDSLIKVCAPKCNCNKMHNVRKMLQDLNRDGMKIDIEDLERSTARLYDAIAMGALVNVSTDSLLVD